MVWYIILIIFASILTLVLVEIFALSKIYILYKNEKLDIDIRTPFYKKKFSFDFEKGQEVLKEESVVGEEKEKESFSDKAKKIKERIFTTEKGFDIDEIKKVWNEFSETYSVALGILKKIFIRLRYKINITKLYIKLEYGTDNPANTGMIYGSIWGVVGTIYPILTRYFKIEYPSIDLTPDFNEKRFDIEARSIIKVRAVHIINTAFSSLLSPAITYFKDKKLKGSEKNGR